MHPEVLAFIGRVVGPRDTTNDRVLEIGSFNINGTPRPFFAAAQRYVGIDRRDGRDVDIVSEAKDYQPDEEFTVVVSCETLEHADDPADIIDCAWRSLAPGGLLVLTAAGPGRKQHDQDGNPSTSDPYTVIDKHLLNRLLANWDQVTIEYGQSHGRLQGDIYALATKPSKSKQKRVEATKASKTAKVDQADEQIEQAEEGEGA